MNSEQLTPQEQIAEDRRIAFIKVANYRTAESAAKSPTEKIADIMCMIVVIAFSLLALAACLM